MKWSSEWNVRARLSLRRQIRPQLLAGYSPAPDSTYTLAESLIDLYHWTLRAEAKAPLTARVCAERCGCHDGSWCLSVLQFNSNFPLRHETRSCQAFFSRISYTREMRGTWAKARTEWKQFGGRSQCEAAVFDQALCWFYVLLSFIVHSVFYHWWLIVWISQVCVDPFHMGIVKILLMLVLLLILLISPIIYGFPQWFPLTFLLGKK